MLRHRPRTVRQSITMKTVVSCHPPRFDFQNSNAWLGGRQGWFRAAVPKLGTEFTAVGTAANAHNNLCYCVQRMSALDQKRTSIIFQSAVAYWVKREQRVPLTGLQGDDEKYAPCPLYPPLEQRCLPGVGGCHHRLSRIRLLPPLWSAKWAKKGREWTGAMHPSAPRQTRVARRILPWGRPGVARDGMYNALNFDRIRKELPGVCMTLGLVAILTAVLFALVWQLGLAHGSVVFLIPVVIAATRWGVVSAIVAAICGVLASAFFFYPPLYSFRIRDPQEVLDLILFIFVAVTVSQLATRLKRQLEMARQREIDLRDLYAFSRRLAVAFDVSDIHAAIEDHLASVMQRNVVLFPSAREASNSSGRRAGVLVPEQVLGEVVEVASGHRETTAGATVTAPSGEIWLVRAVSPKNREFGVIAINLGRESKERSDELRVRVDAVLADATATLERLGVAHAISEARMR